LAWRGPPAREHVLTVTDADAGGFVHWVVYGLPGSTVGLREGRLPQGTRAGANGFGDTGYGGPCPPPGDGPHRYVFTLYGLDEPVAGDLAPGATLSEVLGAIDCCVVAKGNLSATFARG
jgi:Raf kinase inhibitor-like YbhB/YbcL family protein